MPQDNCQKIKLLKLMEILRQETDEYHPMKTGAICEKLCAMGTTCDRRTLHKDIKLLNKYGYEIMKELIDHENAYYIADRSFSVPELKILIDAVQAASFVTDKRTEELIDKIAELGGSNRAKILKSNIVHFNTRKHSNEAIFYNIDALEEAIRKNKKIIFKYYDLGIDGKPVYRRDGHHYVVEPIALVFNEDNYYLEAYSCKHLGTTTYRVDRMSNVEIIDEKITKEAKALRKDIAKSTKSSFKMYGGEIETVTLQFDKKLIGAVYDKFGEDTKMTMVDENTVTTTVDVQISPTFKGWLAQFGEDMKCTMNCPCKN